MSGVALVPGKSQVSDANGNPLAGGTVDVYLAGTTTRTNSWQDQALTTLNTNPIVLDASGSCSMWLDGSTLYKIVVKNAAGAVQSHLGGDNISGASGSGSLVSFLQAGTGAVSRTAQNKMRDFVSVKDFGAAGDGVTNDTAAIQAAIDYLAGLGGGVVYFPRGTYLCVGVVLKTGVELASSHSSFGYLPTANSGVTLKAAATGYIVDTPAGLTTVCGVSGINFLGLGAGTACVGVRFQNVDWGFVKGCNFRLFADQAILKNAGFACVFEDILVLESLLNRTRASKNGVVEVAAGTDDFLHRIEANPNVTGAVTSSNLYVCAIRYAGSNAFITNCVGEFADVGVRIEGLLNRVFNTRADTNVGHGWEITGTQNQIIGCYGQKNSQGAANTYDQFNVSGNANVLIGLSANYQSGLAPKYSFNDTFNGESGKNRWALCISAGAGTAEFNNDPFAGSGFTFGYHPGIRIASGTTTPDVTNTSRIALSNASPTTITNLLGGINGQIVDIYVGDNNTTIASGSGFSLFGGVSMPLRAFETYRFYKDGANWKWEDYRHRELMSADNGDAGKTLTVGSSERAQIWKTPLTANRAVGLSTAGARSGDTFKITRTAAATGASTLDIGSGPLKSIAAGQWVEVTYDGSAWVLTAFGSL